ncbi:MAG: hypothetical protein WCS42_02635 [Verrucomicrobiota bacterium]
MFGIFKRKDDSKRFVTTASEVASFVETLDESGRARLLLCAQEFRQRIAPDSPQIDEMLLRPADFSTADCSAIYRQMEHMQATATSQSQQTVSRIAEMGIKDDRLTRELEFQRYAMRLWMTALAARLCPDCLEPVRAVWLALTGVADETIRKVAATEQAHPRISASCGVPRSLGVSLDEVIRDIRIVPSL